MLGFSLLASAPSVRWQLSRTATVEVDAIKFIMSTGNIASGKIYLYGLK
jgi:hypothetical protein